MSLYSAMFAGVSGLSAESSAMAAVADNISNINTVGYKNTDTQFSTLVGEGRAGAAYAAGGVNSVSRSLISKAGLLSQSSSATDLGIDGQGFFVTRTSSDASSPVAFTRAGSFTPDKEGYLRNTAGLYLQGWKLDATGNYTNTGSTDALQTVRLSDLSGSATATTSVKIAANFSSTATASTYTPGDLEGGNVTPSFSRAIDVFDAQGGTHRLMLAVVKTAPNTWNAEIYSSVAGDATAGLPLRGKIVFNADGSFNRGSSDFPTNLNPTWLNKAGSSPITLDFGSDKGFDGLTQTTDVSSLKNAKIDGGLRGAVASVNVSDSGRVSAVFENGTQLDVFQLPIALVANPDGLTRTSGNAFTPSNVSGGYKLQAASVSGAGKVQAFKLEASTADLAAEFTNMIRFQRAYSASSKIITTVDDMLQEVSNLKR